MKLAQALIERKVLKNKIRDQIDLIDDSATIQEGDPKPDIDAMLGDLLLLYQQHDDYDLDIREANRTHTIEQDGEELLLEEAIALRDLWKLRASGYNNLSGGGMRGYGRQFRRTQSEIKFVELLDREHMMKERDTYAEMARNIDALIQAKNWEVDL